MNLPLPLIVTLPFAFNVVILAVATLAVPATFIPVAAITN